MYYKNHKKYDNALKIVLVYEVKKSVKINDDKAEYTINNKELVLGENNININVKDEDGSIENYTLIINRLSSDTNIRIVVNGEKINFVKEKASITVPLDTKKLDYEYDLGNERAKVEIIEAEISYAIYYFIKK